MPKAKKTKGQPGKIAPSPGDLVKLICNDAEYEGVLLPTTGTTEFVPLKLPSGYNIGVSRTRVKKTLVLEKASAVLKGATLAKSASPLSVEKGKPHISVLACGGTIASRIDYRTGAVDPLTSPEELIASFPQARFLAPIRAKTLFSLNSEDIAPAHWIKAAHAVSEEIKGGSEGVVITHGTDTMSFTSAALSFMLQKPGCPVILTGSQRSSDRGSSDAETNMHAALLAARADLSGVFVCMHEGTSDSSCLLHFGTKVRKMHTSRRDAFRSINTLPAARILLEQQKVEKISERCEARGRPGSVSLDTKLNENVALVYSYPGMKPDFISSLSKYDGVVIAGSGLGHLPVNLGGDPLARPILNEISGLIKSGIPVFLAPQTIYGRIDMNVYSDGRALLDIGVIGNLCDLTPECAYVKLMWVLGHEKKMEKVKGLMEKSIVGEITERSEISPY